jgi:hypothetical protein
VRAALGRLADLLEHHAIGFGIERAPVLGYLPIVGELIIVAEIEAELRPRRRNAALGGGRAEDRGGEKSDRSGADG